MIHPYRQRNLIALANKLNFSFHAEDDYGLLAQLGDVKLFREGRKRKVERILRRQDGLMEFDISAIIFLIGFLKKPAGPIMKK